jgi:hypothetical protein
VSPTTTPRRRRGRPVTSGNGSPLLRLECDSCGMLARATRGALIKAGGLPLCACNGSFTADPEIEQLFKHHQSINGKGNAVSTISDFLDEVRAVSVQLRREKRGGFTNEVWGQENAKLIAWLDRLIERAQSPAIEARRDEAELVRAVEAAAQLGLGDKSKQYIRGLGQGREIGSDVSVLLGLLASVMEDAEPKRSKRNGRVKTNG